MSTIFKLFSDSEDALHLSAGERLFSAGDKADKIYFVLSGKIDLLVNEKIIESILPGSLLGEIAMLNSAGHVADAIAEKASTVVPVTPDRFQFLVEQTPFFAMDVMKAMAERIHSRLPE
ncbi:MAG: Crp/Fnr family transcriptional regulator [Thiotrichales bacterium]